MWKFAVITPIRKPGKPASEVKSYRPIAMLSNLSKVWERVILAKLSDWMAAEGLIPENQFGFVAGLSSTHALAALGSIVASQLNERSPVIAVWRSTHMKSAATPS